MLEFDFERNRRAGLDPDKIMAGSAKMVHWIRTKCPRGRAHLFVASPHNRIGLNYGCPYCAGKKACICNSLQSLYPVLAAEYDTARNGDGPQQVLAGSAKMAFWKDATGHTWKQAVRQRTEPSQQRAKRAAIKHYCKESCPHPDAAQRLVTPAQTIISRFAAATVSVMAERRASKPEIGSQNHAK
ncbi:MAG: hypothetical protein FRX49_09711 [Trebouxia sp. A1-2]|nr:MAG: hypothetical protein FRX49_09711 [Trebouxia sp. A1-2]